ncbi:MAG: hypothetical protein K8E24_005530 [Methanobacterium paludis]|nr:hypothetical protein [Methanobacterium paludis]
MIELLFFLIMVFVVAIISRKIDKLPISAQMILCNSYNHRILAVTSLNGCK